MTSALTDPAWNVRLDLPGMTLCYSDCKKPLSATSQRQIVESLHDGMAEYNIRQYFHNQPTIFSDYDLLVAAGTHPEDRPVGILGGRWFTVEGRRTLYLWTGFMADSHRGTHVFRQMLALFLGMGCDPDPGLVCLKTFSPKVYEAVARMCQLGAQLKLRIYPQIPAPAQDPELAELASRAMAQMFPTLPFAPDTGLVRGGQESVGIEVFPGMPKSSSPAVMQHFERHVSSADQIFVMVDTSHAKRLGKLFCALLSPEVTTALRERKLV